MTEQDLIKKLAQLKKVEPDKNWVIFCRQNLEEKLKLADKEKPALPEFLSFLRQIVSAKAVLRPAPILVVIFGLIFTTGLVSLVKAKSSLPGDRFYPVKIALEQAKLLATTSTEGKVELQGEMMTLRLEELSKIAQGQEPTEEKQEKLEEVLTNLQRQLLTIKDELPKLGKGEAKKAVEMARKIDANVSQVAGVLSQAKATLSPSEIKQNLTEKITEATETADKASTQALGVIVEKQGETGEPVDQSDIIAKLDEKIQKLEQRIGAAKQLLANYSNIGNQLPIDNNLVEGLLNKAEELIKEAKADLESGDIAKALQTISSATEFIKSAEKILESVTPLVPAEPSIPEENQNATGTPSNLLPATTTTSSFIPKTSLPANTAQVGSVTTSVQGANISSE